MNELTMIGNWNKQKGKFKRKKCLKMPCHSAPLAGGKGFPDASKLNMLMNSKL